MENERGGATGPQTVTCSQVSVKEENDGDSTAGHLHRLKVKFSHTALFKYTIDCDRPRTVMDAIKSTENYKKMVKCSDENIVIQLGKGDKKYIVATHFPCSCIREGESLILSYESEKVEVVQDQRDKKVQPRDKYSVFYIDTVGGLYTKQKRLFRNNAVTQFKYLCVYGEKGMTVEEALERDGRFMDDLSSFTLSDNANPSRRTEHTQKVDNLDNQKFKICLPRQQRKHDEGQQEKPGASKKTPQKRQAGIKRVDDIVKQRGVSVRAAMKERDSNVSDEKIYELLRQQFPALKAWMESRFPVDYYQKALDLKKEDFGKIQRLFSEVHRVRKILKLGKSVCKVVVKNGKQGTGFVLFDNYILTNAHILENCVEGSMLKAGIDVDIFFNYDEPEPHTNYNYFQAQREVCGSEGELDYAILALKLEGQDQSMRTNETNIPPGLLKIFGEPPKNGEACLVGHPAGELKKIDPTCIIEKEKREQAVLDHFHPYKDKRFIVHLITDLKQQGIDNIIGGNRADNVSTFNTFMYHGASGSPVFDVHGNVFGLHTAGFVYGYPFHTTSVIEYAQPVLTIFEDFVRMMTERENTQSLLRRAGEEVKGNPLLEEVFKSAVTGSRYEALLGVDAVKTEPANPDEHSDSSESMDTDEGRSRVRRD